MQVINSYSEQCSWVKWTFPDQPGDVRCGVQAPDAEVVRGEARRGGRILYSGGAGTDHPVHPYLPESAYLKGLLLQLD